MGWRGTLPGGREAGRNSGSASPTRPPGARVSPGPGLRSEPGRTDSSRTPGRLRDRRAIRAPRRSRTPFSRAPSPGVTAPRSPSGRRAAPRGSPPGDGRGPAPERGRHRRRHGSHRGPPTLPPPRTPRELRVATSRRPCGKFPPRAPPSSPADSTPPSTGPPPPTARLSDRGGEPRGTRPTSGAAAQGPTGNRTSPTRGPPSSNPSRPS